MYLGVDLGTSSVKLVLLDEQQNIIGSSGASLCVSRPHPLWSEQDPAAWWRGTEEAFFNLKLNYPQQVGAIKAIGLSGQMHGAVLINDKGEPIRPAILWNDGRSFQACDTLLHREPDAIEITGNLIMPGFTAPKLLWLQENEPDNFAKIHKVLLPKDYLRFRLTGEFATDMSDASGTCWLDVAQRQWSDKMLAATDLSQDHMPELFEGNQVTSTLSKALATHWGISPEVQVIAGAGDNAASAVSVNVTKPGEAFISLGTSGVYFIADDQYRSYAESAVHSFCHCLPGRWHEMNVHLSAASCLDWLAKLTHSDVDTLLSQAETHQLKNVPIFLPYLSGERTPHNDPHARGAFFGMSYDTDASALMQSVLEGVALAFAEGQQILQDKGVEIQEVNLVGGGSRSAHWAQLLASVLQRPMAVLDSSEVGGALGAAKLAWLGHTAADISELQTPSVTQVFDPDVSMQRYYEERLGLFKNLYRDNRSYFGGLYRL
ncbi:MAG: xylulokinase [Coxiellaceae bacterium]|nr:xylulokinase [Coxiellaceae bacterium]